MIEVQQSKKRCLGVLAATLATCSLVATSLHAGTIPSGAQTLPIGQSVKLNLLTSGEIPGVVVGDKLFKEFIYSWTNNMPAPENVNVTAIIDSDDNFGIRFQGSFSDLPGDLVASDASLSFSVHVVHEPTNGNSEAENGYGSTRFLISDAHLKSAVFLDEGTPGSFGSVDESFLGNVPQIPQTLHVFNSTLGQGGKKSEDGVIFDNTYEWLHVQKDIYAFAAEGANAPVRMTIIDQTFSQVEIPEPSSATILMMLGSVAVMGFSRRSL
ncbi:hypothetical protein Pr1d_12930 [Bythopirellula goksoeyrii]|uniref:Uncharacterized protein n=2 Tax=Bythopirellula goksoeyrii TaxID=1400387 RepID=A0A5B9QIG7_9BACT|nr:hypothetical protein Pr1d_12930 [Bythopirellula goksoeyrii]